MHKAAIMGACAASTVALNVAMQHFTSGSSGGRESGNDSEDDEVPPGVLVDNMNAQLVALVYAEGMPGADLFGATRPENSCVRPRSPRWWNSFISEKENRNPDEWRSLFKISRPTFDYISSLVRLELEPLQSSNSVRETDGEEMTVEKQVAIALRRLSSGDSVTSVGVLFAVESDVVSKVTWRFIRSLTARARHHLKWPEGTSMERVKRAFENLTGFRNCCGVVGSAHFRLSLPSEEASDEWLNNNGNASMVAQAIVDTSLRFLDVCIGWPGSSDEATVLQNSTFYRLCEAKEKLNGPVTALDARSVSEYVLGSAAHPLLPWLITPYPGGVITQDGRRLDRTRMQMAFNERHEATRAIVDRTFAHLKGTWRILHKAKQNPNPQKLSKLIFACCLLHNILLDKEESTSQDLAMEGLDNESSSPRYADQCADSEGWQIRDGLAGYFWARQGL